MNKLDLSKITPDPINPQKFVKTRAGHDVYIYWIGEQQIHGRLPGEQCGSSWTLEGEFRNGYESVFNLVMVEEEEVRYAAEMGFRLTNWCGDKSAAIGGWAGGAEGIIKKTLKGGKVVKIEYEEIKK